MNSIFLSKYSTTMSKQIYLDQLKNIWVCTVFHIGWHLNIALKQMVKSMELTINGFPFFLCKEAMVFSHWSKENSLVWKRVPSYFHINPTLTNMKLFTKIYYFSSLSNIINRIKFLSIFNHFSILTISILTKCAPISEN